MQSTHSIEEELSPIAAHGPDNRTEWSFGPMAGRSPVMLRLFSQMHHIARHLRIATLEGPSGTGKLLAARALHECGVNPQSPFVRCLAVQLCEAQPGLALVPPRSTPKSEFSALPAIKQSCGGTLVLTRIDELISAHQARLVELLQWVDHQHILHMSDSIPRRILCLTSQPLRKLASTAALRADLVNRLAAIRFTLPPLRERSEDIPLLADLFAQRFSGAHGKSIRGLNPQALPRLMQHTWPGNVRELESVIYAAALNCHGQWIRPIDLPTLTTVPVPSVAPRSFAPDDDPNLDRAILRHIQQVLARVEGNKLRAAKLLGISRSTLYRLLDTAAASRTC